MRSPEDDPLAALSNEIDQKWPDTMAFDARSQGSITQAIMYDGYPDPKEVPLIHIAPKPYDGRPKHPKAEALTLSLAAIGTSVLLAKTVRSAIKRVK